MSVTKTYFITIFLAFGIIFAFLFFKTDVFNSPVIPIVNAAPSCSCDCAYNPQTNKQESKYCGKVGSTGEYTSSGESCYAVDWHCNAEADSSGSCVTKNHLYKDKGAQVDNSYCSSNPDPTDPPDPSNPSGSVYVSSRNGSSATVCNTFNRSVSIGVNRCQKNYDEPQVCSEVKYAAVCGPSSETVGAGSTSQPNCAEFNVGIPGCGVWQLDISYNGSSLYGESDCNFNSCKSPETGVCTNIKYTVTPAQPKIGEEVTIEIDRKDATNCHGNWDFLYFTVNGQKINTAITGDTKYTAKYTPTAAGNYEIQMTFNADKVGDYGDDLSECPCNKASFTVLSVDTNVSCKSLTGKVIGTGKFIGQTPQLSELPNDFTGVVTLTCTSESKPKAVNKMEFTFVKDTVEQKKTVNTNIDCSEKAGVFSCSGKATFDVTGSASYSAKSKICIVDGVNEICSP
jgi:hypothetical protein